MKKGKKFYVADPGKGKTTYNLEDFKQHWISTRANGEDKGIAMFFETTPAFFTYQMEGEENKKSNGPLSSFWDISRNIARHSLG